MPLSHASYVAVAVARIRKVFALALVTVFLGTVSPATGLSAGGTRSPASVLGSRAASMSLNVVPGTSGRIEYTGRWRRGAYTAALGGRIRTARQAGASASLTFTGSEVWWVGRRGPNHGRAKVYVDGRLVRHVRTFAARRSSPQVLFHMRWARPGSHSIKIVVVGRRRHPAISVEAIVVGRGRVQVSGRRPTPDAPDAPVKPSVPEPQRPPEPPAQPDPPVVDSPSYDAVFGGDASGSTDVTSQLRSFLQSHNGQRVALAPGGVYKVSQLSFTARNLTVDFRGARMVGNTVGAHGILRLQDVVNVTLNDPKVYGTGYTWASKYQSEHGIQIDGGSRIVLNRPVTRDTRGDGIYIGYQAGKNEPSTGVVIRDPDIQRAARNGIAPVAGEVTIRGGKIARTGLHGIDFEPNNDKGARSIRGIIEGVDVRRHGDLPEVGYTSYAVAAGGYSTDTKQLVSVQGVTGDSLRMTIRNTAKAIVRDNVSDKNTTADFRSCNDVSFASNTRISR